MGFLKSAGSIALPDLTISSDQEFGAIAMVAMDGKPAIVEYEPDSDLRDTEQVPLLEEGGIEAFFRREVLPHVPDAWIDHSKTKVGYEIPLNRHFYVYQPPRALEEIAREISQLEKEIVAMLGEVV